MTEDSLPKTTDNKRYEVLARKYRPQHFDDLIGQDALVRTLKNAIEKDRIAHAFMLTGIRGVGKTTTARIIAKALNYTGPDGNAGPTAGPTDDCDICRAITEDRHPDVMEMDAASRTGVDDIREILDGVRYAPVSARYKIYIIDEVHMLSKAAFNALLKTLEEPPPHVKFIFATTEIRKVPVTVLSRCQRFDLKRVPPDTLADYYAKIAEKEGAKIEEDALSMIGRAADGSVRDGLSLLDQAISMADGEVTGERVKDMMGLADRGLIMDLCKAALEGNGEGVIKQADHLSENGADPRQVLHDLLEIVHQLTRGHVAGDADAGLEKLAALVSMPTLTRAWQIILNGIEDLQRAPDAQRSFEMTLMRLAYAANLPDPVKLVEKLKDEQPSTSSAPAAATAAKAEQREHGEASSASTHARGGQEPADLPPEIYEPQQPTASLSSAPAANMTAAEPAGTASAPAAGLKLADNESSDGKITDLRSLMHALQKGGQVMLAAQIYHHARLNSLKEQSIDLALGDNAPARLSQDLSQGLKAVTGARWVVSVSPLRDHAALTLAEEDDEIKQADRAQIMKDPLVKAVFQHFPEAELKEINDTPTAE